MRKKMLEKLNLNFLNSDKKFNVYDIELFIELINNYIQWDIILKIMNIKNENQIIERIDKRYSILNNQSSSKIPKVNRFDWLLRKRLRHKTFDDYVNKCFTYPILLWLLSLNILTFLLIYLLPNLINSFDLISKVKNNLHFYLNLTQLIIGFEWGLILLFIYIVLNIKDKSVIMIYKFIYMRYPNNIFVSYVSFMYLSDFLYLLNLNISINEIMNILCHSNSIYRNISDTVKENLNLGKSLRNSFILLDETFLKLIQIEDYERKFENRLEKYLKVIYKQLEIKTKVLSNYFMSIVYIQIAFMVFLVYSVLLYPLKLIEGMNL